MELPSGITVTILLFRLSAGEVTDLEVTMPPEVWEGEGALLNCTVNDDALNIFWFKDIRRRGHLVYTFNQNANKKPPFHSLSGRAVAQWVGNVHQIYINKTNLTDEGTYICESGSLVDRKNLTVNVKPQGVIITGLAQTVRENREVEVICNISRVKPRADIYWRMGTGGSLQTGNTTRVSKSKGTFQQQSTYKVSFTRRDHNTQLYCIVTRPGNKTDVWGTANKIVKVSHIDDNVPVPMLLIGCVRNCASRPNVHEAVELKLIYKTPSMVCVSIVWSITPSIDWERDSGTGNNGPFLSIYENVLQPGTVNDVHVRALCHNEATQNLKLNTSRILQMATPPTLGTCFVAPAEGVFLQDMFSVNCSGFDDPTALLTYMFYMDPGEYTTNIHGLLLYVGVNQSFMPPMMLPAKHQHSYTATIRVVVADGLDAANFVETHFRLLRSAKKGSELQNMKMLKDRLQPDDIQGAVNLAQSGLAVIRNASADEKALATDLHADLSELVIQIKNKDLTTVRLKANLLNELTAASVNSGLDLQLAAAVSFKDMTVFLQKVSFRKQANDAAASLDAPPMYIKEAARAIYEGCLRLIDTATQNVSPGNIEGVKRLSEQLSEALDNVASTIINAMVPGRRTIELKMDDDIMVLKKGGTGVMGNQTFVLPPIPGDERVVTLTLHETTMVEETEATERVVGIGVLRTKQNPYAWSSSSKHIIPGVISVAYYRESDVPKQLDGLKPNINITFPISRQEKTNSSATVKVSYIEGRTEVHQDDLIIFALPVFSNKRYLIKMSATAEIRLVLVVKVHSKPELLDLYGGDTISKNATLLVIDFAAKGLLWRAYSHPATGLEYVLKEANSTCVSLVGTLHSKEEKTMLYFAVMPAVYDEVLCKRCMANSEGPCGFCSGKERTTAGTVLDVKVTTIVYMADCVFWSQNKGEWRHDGCEVLPEMTSSYLSCGCNHLSTFGGRFFVPPVQVDIFKFSLLQTIWTNSVVPSAVLVAWSIYVMLVVWARHRDQKDNVKLQVTYLAGNAVNAEYYYWVAILTGIRGTTGKVSVILIGENGTSAKHVLENKNIQLFQIGSEHWFIMAERRSLGRLRSVVVWVDYSNAAPSWFLNQITVCDIQTKKNWHFVCDNSLTPEEDKNIVETSLDLCEVHSYRYAWRMKAMQGLRDQHLWISIFTCPPHSLFTRVQRLSCAFAFIMSSMLTSIIFYKPMMSQVHEKLMYLHVSIKPDDYFIALESALITIPVNVFLVFVFRFVTPHKPTCYNLHSSYDNSDDSGSQSSENSSDNDESDVSNSNDIDDHSNIDDIDLQSIDSDISGQEPRQHVKKSTSFSLPWWWIYIGWTLTIATCTVSTYIVVMFGLEYGSAKSITWLVSFLMSATANIAVVQPFKVVIIAIVFTFLFRSPVQPTNDATRLANLDAHRLKN